MHRFEDKDFCLADLCYDKSESCFARIVLSPLFVVFTMIAISANCLWLGYDVNYNQKANIWDAEARFQVVENLFCAIFFLELLVRFLAYKYKVYAIQDMWFVFDFVLVVMMVGETWILQPILYATGSTALDSAAGDFSILRMLRLLKLVRLSRMGRLLRFFPELLTMMKGIGRAMVSVFFAVTLLTMLLYCFGIILKTTAEGNAVLEAKFPSVGESMWYLLLHATLLDAIGDEVPII